MRPKRITADPPPQPYVDVCRVEILRRVFAKEVLRTAFSSLHLFVREGGDNIHGEFGGANDWNQPAPPLTIGAPPRPPVRELVSEWIQQHPVEITSLCNVLLAFTDLQASASILIQYVQQDLVGAIDGAIADPNFAEDSLSKLLATAGLLPMFGFPSRMRILHHARPRGQDWPPEDVIDREIDIAISQFAPGSESVKEGVVYTAVGVVDYRRQGNTVIEVPNPLGPPIHVGICKDCQAVSTTMVGATCQICGAGAPTYSEVDLSQPRGFRTWYGAHRDFDGTFDFAPRATRPRTGVDQLPLMPLPSRNCQFWSNQSLVYMVNDNAGRLFTFQHLALPNSQTWVVRDVLPANVVANQGIVGTSDVRALASVERTDVLILGILAWPPGIKSCPVGQSGLPVRAAVYSLGFLLRRGMAALLDIGEKELSVGLRPVPDTSGPITGQVFISDSLENGAGYSSYFGDPGRLDALLSFLVGTSTQDFYGPLVHPSHAGQCLTSCPDCMRDFGNLAYHPILDWRLGLDLARLALDAVAPIDFTVPYWQGLDATAGAAYFGAQPGWQHGPFHGVYAGWRNDRLVIITHPLWQDDVANPGPQLAAACVQAASQGRNVSFKSIFEVYRRPY